MDYKISADYLTIKIIKRGLSIASNGIYITPFIYKDCNYFSHNMRLFKPFLFSSIIIRF